MYLLLRADVAYEHLRGHYRYRLNQYMSHLPTEANVEPLPDDWWKGRPQERKDFIIEQIAREVEQELNAAKRGPVSYSGLSSYDVIHRLESAISVHAGYAVFDRYLTISVDQSREEVVARRSSMPSSIAGST